MILEIRRLSGLTLEEIAKALKVSLRTVHHWANEKPLTEEDALRIQCLLNLVKLIDRCNSRVNRFLFLAADKDGILPFNLLCEERFNAVLALIGSGDAPRKSSSCTLSSQVQQTRRPPAPIDLLEALQDRPVQTSRAIPGKSFRLPKDKDKKVDLNHNDSENS
jgi:transcriptional regulator with XRE-family HTH domain